MFSIVFVTIFALVAAIVAGTVALALWRARRDLVTGKAVSIQWHASFEDLPARDRICRHEFTVDFRRRHCELGFDCRECGTHARLAEARPPEASDRLYHRGHTFVARQADGTVNIGLDDLGRKMFGRIEQVELPPPGTRLQVNGTAWKVRQRGDEFRVLSPVDGEVLETGGPDDGFYLRVRMTGSDAHLLRGKEAQIWMMRELERLQILISPNPNMPSLADGGVLVDDAPDAFPEVNWPQVWGEMLLEP